MYKVNQIKLNINHSEKDLRNKIAKMASVSVGDIDWSTLIILHRAIDARDKKNILFVYNVAFDFVGETRHESVKKLERYEPVIFNPIILGSHSSPIREGSHGLPIREGSHSSPVRPVVVGFGPAGIFAAYIFALNGLKPIVVERGKAIEDRIKDTEKFFETMELDEESNVCFGEGGAGAFSDGKLNTNNKDKTGVYRFILETFVKFGADEKILYENLPHVGTDKLVEVIKNIRNEILKLGGEIYYNTKFAFEDGAAKLVPTGAAHVVRSDKVKQYFAPTSEDSQSFAPTNEVRLPIITKDMPIILAIGNSSRDTFRELIKNGFDVKAKPIAVGYRIAHRQRFIDYTQYGSVAHEVRDYADVRNADVRNAEVRNADVRNTDVRNADAHEDDTRKILGPATYKLTYDVGDGHSVYSFCMCPGGYIINSSNYKGKLAINGMSYNDRSGKYANSAIVETVRAEDIDMGSHSSPVQEGSHSSPVRDESQSIDPVKMIEFQEQVEKAAFELNNGYIPYIVSGTSDICKEDVFKGQAKYCEKLKSVYENCGIKFDINKDIEAALMHFNKIMPGFFATSEEHVIVGVETRTSSPIKLDRDENYMCNVPNFYPCGEGLGHGGGIISSAADGINVAKSIILRM